MSANPHVPTAPVRLVLADAMPGVRDAWRWLLSGAPDVAVAAECGTAAEAITLPGDVLLCGLRLPDGTAADVIAASARPVLVWVFLPEDERIDVDLSGAFAVLPAGSLREQLAQAVRQAAEFASGA